MADYYLSAAGNDAGVGTYGDPWKSLTRLNSGPIGRNDRAFLRRGDVFHGRLNPPTNLNPSLPGWLKISAYGDGNNPEVSGYKLLNVASGWVQHDADTWKLDYSAANAGVTYTGYDSSQGGGDIGILKIDGVIHAVNRYTLPELANQWDYHSDGTTLYVRSTAKPTTLASDIKASVDGNGANLRSAIELSHLTIAGDGAHGVRMFGAGAARCRVRHCTIEEMGGSYLDHRRYGNGVEVWCGANISSFYAEHNIVRDCYDTAFTIQGGAGGVTTTATDIMWRRNLTYRNSQAEEYWYGGAGGGFVNCVSEYNTNLFSGYGWGADVRPDQAVRASQLTYGWGEDADLTLRRNIYHDAYALSYNSEATPGLASDRNVILMRPGAKMRYQDSETVEDATEWASTSGREQSSIVRILPAGEPSIEDSGVTAAIAALGVLAPMGQKVGATFYPIHSPWRV